VGGVGEVNGKDGAAAGVFAGDDLTALRDDEAADDRETEAEAAGAGGVAALKFLKETLTHRGREAGAAVGDGEENADAGVVDAGGEENRRGGGRMVRGVEEEVGDDLLHERGVGAEEREVVGNGDLERMGDERITDAVEGGVDEIVGIAPIEAGLECAGFEARLVEEIIDEPIEAAGGGGDFRGEGEARGFVGGGEAFSGSAEDGEGSFQLVGNAIEERAVEFLGFGEEFFAVAGGAEVFALDDEGELRGEAFGEVALGEREGGVGWDAQDEDAERAVVAEEWNVKTLGGGQRVGEAAGFFAVAPGPVGDAAFFFGEGKGAGEVGGEGIGAVVIVDQSGLCAEERVGLAESGEDGVVERACGGEGLREMEERGGAFLAEARMRAVRWPAMRATAK
jgi:hypothetical protein